jgi:transposase
MFIRKRKNKSGSTTIVVVDKSNGRFTELHKIGASKEEFRILELISQGIEWIRVNTLLLQPELDLYGEESEAKLNETEAVERFLSNISNILINGTGLILNRIFDRIGFNEIKDVVLRKLVLSRLSYPAGKSATVEYLKNHFDEDVALSRIYRYLDKLGEKQHNEVQRISVEHTRKILGGLIGVMFYDVTTLYFETDREDELRKTGFSKEGKHSNPQIILGLLVSLDAYPLAYCIHEGTTR